MSDYEVVDIFISSSINVNDFIKEFNDLAKDYLVKTIDASVVCYEGDTNRITFEDYPIFKPDFSLDTLVKSYIKNHRSENFKLVYCITYNVDGSMTRVRYRYNKGDNIYVKASNFSEEIITHCQKCGALLDESITLENYDKYNVYMCNSCNSIIDVDILINKYTLEV